MARLKPLRYETIQDVDMRLVGGFVRFQGTAFYCHSATPDLLVRLIDVSQPEASIESSALLVHSSDEELDISSPPLGWCMTRSGPMYLMRSPKRSQKQSVNPKSLQIFTPNKDRADYRGLTSGYRYDHWRDLLPVKKCIEGVYPPIEEVLKKGIGSFDRNWMLVGSTSDRVSTLYHKFVPVGSFLSDKNAFVFAAGALTKTRRASLEGFLGEYLGVISVYEQP
jgi:hypothetical protein